MTPENAIKYQICGWLARQRCFFFQVDSVGIFDPIKKIYRKNHNPYRIRGVSDILGIWQGKFLAIEVKTKTGQVSDYQKAFLEQVNLSGGIGIVARCVGDLECLRNVEGQR